MSDSEPVETNLDDFEKQLFEQKPEAKEEVKVPEPTPSATENESDVPEAEVTEPEDDGEDNDTPAEDEDETEAEAKAKPKRRRNSQDRIDELTKDKYDLRRRIEELENLVVKVKSDEKPTQAKKPANDTAPLPEAVNEAGELIYPLGELDPQFVTDLTLHTIRMEREAEKKASAEEASRQKLETAQQELTKNWEQKVTAAAERLPDLPEKFGILQETFKDVPQEQGNFVASSIMTLENGPDVLNYFADNLDEARALMRGGIFETIVALGRLDEKFSEKNKEVEKGVAIKATQAPPPPPRTKGSANVKTIRPDTDNLDDFETLLFSSK